MTTIKHLTEQMKGVLAKCEFCDNTFQEAKEEREELEKTLASLVELCYYTGYADAVQDISRAVQNAKEGKLSESYQERISQWQS